MEMLRCVSLADNGIGIPDRYHEKVFELFQRLHSKDKFSGSGIGLAVCKKIMQQMEGDIYISNNPTGGTIFHSSVSFKREYKQ
jgi:signal transduction histidine kinase